VITRLGTEKPESQVAKRIIDNAIDNITEPMLRLINFDYVQEGNDFSSLFRNSTPWVKQA